MDPYIESQKWRDFHASLIYGVREFLTPRVTPRYVVDIEEAVYLDEDEGGSDQVRYPDVSIVEGAPNDPSGEISEDTAVAVMPVTYTLPQPKVHRQRYLAIRERDSKRIVTIIEVLSPTNKSDGFAQYLEKRQEVFARPIHLVELDLLRRGRRPPTVETLEPRDYYAFVCRHEKRPEVQVYGWTLRQRMPPVDIPLKGPSEQVQLDLQSIFNTLYERAGYAYSLNYDLPVEPALSKPDAAWIRQTMSTWVPDSG